MFNFGFFGCKSLIWLLVDSKPEVELATPDPSPGVFVVGLILFLLFSLRVLLFFFFDIFSEKESKKWSKC